MYLIFTSGGSRIFCWGGGGTNLRRGCFVAKMYAKMKELDPVGGRMLAVLPPLDLPMFTHLPFIVTTLLYTKIVISLYIRGLGGRRCRVLIPHPRPGQILSFSHVFLPKSVHVGGQRPHQEILDQPLL